MAHGKKTAKARQTRRQRLGEKASFIRQHPDLGARELVAAAAKQGLVIRPSQVYKVRTAAGTSRQHRARTEPEQRRTRAQPVGEHPSKSAFIRSLPQSMPAKQVVDAARERGIVISETFVYNVRAAARKHGDLVDTRVGNLAEAGSDGAVAGAEAAFRRLVLDLGVRRARALLAEVESRLAALIAGR